MGEARAYMDLFACSFEIEGDEAFVTKELQEIRELIKAGLLPVQQPSAALGEEDADEDGAQEPARETSSSEEQNGNGLPRKKKSHPKKRAVYKVLNVDLRGKGENSLQSFVKAKNPKGNPDRYAVVAHWLKNEHSLDEIGVDHIYTCFKTLSWPIPADIRQIFDNVKRRNGYFDGGSKPGIFRLNVVGENRVEHGLPEQGKK